MKMPSALFAVSAAILLAAPSVVSAQMPNWSKEQMEVWEVVSESWADDVAKNGKWPEAYADEQMVAWEADFPIPRSKASIAKWSRFYDSQGKTLQYEISPVAIAVSGNTAVANYMAVMVTQRADDKPEREVIGITETLVRTGNRWKYLATSGFNMKK